MVSQVLVKSDKTQSSIAKRGLYARYLKRPLDVIIALVALIVLSPLMLVLGILVRINLGSPVIFKQKRPGLNERKFTVYKFRTMTNERDENGNLLPDEERLTRFGKWLRLTSLDELPELFNVLKGDMSLVGPRPLLVKYLPYYKVGERKRHWVRPGLTGLAQVNGRNLLDWDTRLSLDTYYVENMTFYMDLSIMLKTVKNVLLRRDIAMGNKQGLKDLDTERGSSRHDDM